MASPTSRPTVPAHAAADPAGRAADPVADGPAADPVADGAAVDPARPAADDGARPPDVDGDTAAPDTAALDAAAPDPAAPDAAAPDPAAPDPAASDPAAPDTAALDTAAPGAAAPDAAAPDPLAGDPSPRRRRRRPSSDRPPGRAGRNLPAAIGVGVGLGALVLVPLFSPYRWLFVAVVAAAIAVGTREIVLGLRALGACPPLLPLVVGGVAMVTVAYRNGPAALFVTLALTVLGCLVWRMADPAEGFLRDVAAATFTAVYVPFLAGFAALLTVPGDGPRRVAVFVATVVCSDVGGYAAGVLFGKHPMAPTVSPKKSWEGLAGSVTACAVAGAVFFGTLLGANPLLGAVFGLAVVAAATLGDLGESMVKRDIGIKDMGTLLPGHGGIMDRLDSLLPAAPVAWVLLTAFVATPTS